MRCIGWLYVVRRLVLLFAVVIITILYVRLTSQPVQRFNPNLPTATPSIEWMDSRDPHIDPASLLDSPLMSYSVNEQLRVAVYRRLSSKLARYAQKYTGPLSVTSSPADSVTETHSHRVLTELVLARQIRSGTPSMYDKFPEERITSRDIHAVHGAGTEKSSEKAVISNRSLTGNNATTSLNQHTSSPLHVGNQSPHQPSNTTVVTPFSLSRNYHWPQPRAVRPVRDLVTEQWITDLQSCLKRMTSREVTLLTSNQPYREVLLNWLIVAAVRASVDLSQVIVIAMDQSLHSLLSQRGINSVLVRPASFLTASALKEGVFPTVMMTRLSMIRLLNHWGYHIFNYDTDAVLLKDPSLLLKQHSSDDIIGTFGRFPTDLTKKWGITLCTALLVVRSSRATEEFWEAVSRAAPNSYSDQGKMNYGLQAMGVEWSLPSRKLSSLSQSVQGVCHNGLRVSLLPYNIACRAGSCTRKALSSGLYIWHKGGARVGMRKKEGAEQGGVWFLRSDWSVGCDYKTGKDWIQCIAVADVFSP